MLKLLIGTHNPGKLREYRTLLADAPLEIVGLDDIGLDSLDVEETGATFTENAELKAIAYAKASGLHALSDDSGLCVDALDGRPGLHSARYAGEGATDADRRAKLLAEMADIPAEQRTAYFEAVIAVADPATLRCTTTRGQVYGRIAFEESDGPEGFGYDAIFIPEEQSDGETRTFAQFSKAEKNAISHRGRAAQALVPLLKTLSEGD
jgi:XTP/dITP diphosphohydrolase